MPDKQEGKSYSKSISLSPEMWEELNKRAKAKGGNRSDYIRNLIMRDLDESDNAYSKIISDLARKHLSTVDCMRVQEVLDDIGIDQLPLLTRLLLSLVHLPDDISIDTGTILQITTPELTQKAWREAFREGLKAAADESLPARLSMAESLFNSIYELLDKPEAEDLARVAEARAAYKAKPKPPKPNDAESA